VEAPVGDMTQVFLSGTSFLRECEFDDLNASETVYAIKE
jgi:hypothetical protein